MERRNLEAELKQMLVDTLMLETPVASAIDSETPLFGDGIGLDSVDALELGIAISKRYGIQIESGDAALKPAFGSIRSLAEFVGDRLTGVGAVTASSRDGVMLPRLSRDEVEEQVIDFIARQFELPRERVHPEARFFDDLGLDSIDAVELALHLGELTDHPIDETTLRTIVTVGDVIDLTLRLTAQPAGPGSGAVG